MSCLSVPEMQGYLQDREAEDLKMKVERHLVECGRCRGSFDRLAATNHRVNTWLSALASPVEQAPADVAEALSRVASRAQTADSFLAPAAAEIPWYVSLYRNLREVAHPEKLPPLEVTSRAVPVKEIWGLYAANPRSRLISMGIHAAVFSIVLFGITSPRTRTVVRKISVIDPYFKTYIPVKQQAAGGGGGGARDSLPVSAGQAPRPAAKQFVPPMITDHTPKLALDPTVIAPPDVALPQSSLNTWGDPLAKLANGSNGNGSGGGMGGGTNGGLGVGNGPGFGPGSGGGIGGGVYRVGNGVSAPAVIFRVDPEYSDEARKAKYSGTVWLAVIVDPEGRARDIRVTRSLGMGLDEKAIEAVQKWKFRPGMKDGIAVSVRAQIEVNFRLL